MALISVIVPVYKVEPYIHRCVDSILAQSFPDFELILVDDGSPDNCGTICDDYAAKDSRVHVIHQENGGLSAARNAGIDWMFANSDSRWLTFIDSDDWVHREFLQRLLTASQDNGCLMSGCHIFHTAGENFGGEAIGEAAVLSSDDYYCGDGNWELSVVAWGKLYARALFETLRYPVGRLHEDEFTTYKAVYAAGRVALIPAALYAYYRNDGGIIHSRWNPRRMDAIDAFEEQIAFAEAHQNKRLLDRCKGSYTGVVFSYLWTIRREETCDDRVQECRKELQRRLRVILRDKKNKGKYPIHKGNLWVYEEAYPRLPLWKLLHGIAEGIKKVRD